MKKQKSKKANEPKRKVPCLAPGITLPSGIHIIPKMTRKPDGTYEISSPSLRNLLDQMSGAPGEIPEKPPGDQEDQESTD